MRKQSVTIAAGTAVLLWAASAFAQMPNPYGPSITLDVPSETFATVIRPAPVPKPPRHPIHWPSGENVASRSHPPSTVRGFDLSWYLQRLDRVRVQRQQRAERARRGPQLLQERRLRMAVGEPPLRALLVVDGAEDVRIRPGVADRRKDALRASQGEARRAGRHVGIGLAYVVEKSGLGPWESARVAVDGTGAVVVHTGITSVGQGVETVFAQVCADVLGVRYEDVTVRHGDTDALPDSVGTYGSRGTVLGGNAVLGAAERVRDKILAVAARELEAHPADLELRDGGVHVRGVTDRALTLREIARAAAVGRALAAEAEPGLEALHYYAQDKMTYGHGVHVAMAEVDAETGTVRILRYAVVHDIGRAINPMLVEAQIMGGLAQGLGAALHEELAYDETGQLAAGTLMEYHLPAAADLPPVEVCVREEDPSPTNRLGVKGAGEDGIVAAGAAVANAVADALAPLGVKITALPLRPSRLRELIALAVTSPRDTGGPSPPRDGPRRSPPAR